MNIAKMWSTLTWSARQTKVHLLFSQLTNNNVKLTTRGRVILFNRKILSYIVYSNVFLALLKAYMTVCEQDETLILFLLTSKQA
jgi:hypothetical protein